MHTLKKALISVAAASTIVGTTVTAADAAVDSGAAETPTVDVKIVGGKVTQERWPWTVSLGGCGGSLVAPEWVVTAAHCLSGRGPSQIHLDSNDKTSGGELIRVERTYSHPEYGRTDGHDIGLIKLSSPAQATPIPIAAEAGPTGTATKILGWGATTPGGGRGSRLLKELDTQILGGRSCIGIAGPFIDATEICTDNTGGNQGACFGDSGGPQVKQVNGRWELIGATSRGERTCARNPSIYTDVPAHRDWLSRTSGGAITG